MEIRGAIGTLASLTDDQLRRRVAIGHRQRAAVQFHLYGALRSEQRSAANLATRGRPEVAAIVAQDVRTRTHQIAAHIVEGTIQAEKMLAPGAPFDEARAIVRRIWRVRGLHERRTSQAEIARLDADLIALANAASLEVSPGSAA